MQVNRVISKAAGVVLVASVLAEAHTGEGLAGGFGAGFMHPISGLDHVVAMVAVGLWGAFLGKPALWILPVVFPLVMALGGVLGVAGVPLPAVEIGIAVSGIVLGILVALAVKLPLAAAGAIVAIFAIFHGHAHGTELPSAANPLAYSLGFVLATGLLHLGGIAFGALEKFPKGKLAIRGLGVVIALVGVGFLTGFL
jgi:urease accessory protein